MTRSGETMTQSVAWALLGNLTYTACQWGMIVLLAKYGSPDAMGNFTLGLAIGAPLMLLGNMQLRSVLSTDSDCRWSFGPCLALRTITSVLAVVAIAIVTFAAGYAWLTTAVILCVGCSKAFEAVSDVCYGLCQRHMRLRLIAVSMVLKGLLTVATFFAVLWCGGSELSATAAMAALWGAMLLGLDLPVARRLAAESNLPARAEPALGDLQRLILLAFPLGVVEMLASFHANLPRYAVEMQLGTTAQGEFAAMLYLVVAGSTIVHALSQAAVPRFAQAFAAGDRGRFWRLLRQILLATASIGLLGVLAAFLAGGPILTFIYRESFALHADTFVVIMVAALWQYLAVVAWFALTATRRFRIQVPLFVSAGAVNLLLCAWLAPAHGMLGVAIAFAVAECFRTCITFGLLIYILRQAPAANTASDQSPGEGDRPRKRIAVVATVDFAVKTALRGHLAALSPDHDVTVLTSSDDPATLARLIAPARVEKVTIARGIDLLKDLRGLWSLWRAFRTRRYDVVLSITPKAGLLSMLAATLAGVPTRIHIFTGQVWATRRGWRRQLLKAADRCLAFSATHLLADSLSQRDFLAAEGIAPAARIDVLADGSVAGVDTFRFRPDPAVRSVVRTELGVPPGSELLLFLGRLNRDKGVLDLGQAFATLAGDFPQTHLAFVGPDEGGMQDAILKSCDGCHAQVHFVGYTASPERYMAAADILCLPSYREGFGSVVIEAAAAGLPTVASRIYGLTDAVEDGRTGLLHQPGDAERIVESLRRLLESPQERFRLGQAARDRALQQFSAERVTAAFVKYFDNSVGRSQAA